MVHKPEKVQIKYFAQTHSFVVTCADFAATTIIYVSLALWSFTKDFFTIQKTVGSWSAFY